MQSGLGGARRTTTPTAGSRLGGNSSNTKPAPTGGLVQPWGASKPSPAVSHPNQGGPPSTKRSGSGISSTTPPINAAPKGGAPGAPVQQARWVAPVNPATTGSQKEEKKSVAFNPPSSVLARAQVAPRIRADAVGRAQLKSRRLASPIAARKNNTTTAVAKVLAEASSSSPTSYSKSSSSPVITTTASSSSSSSSSSSLLSSQSQTEEKAKEKVRVTNNVQALRSTRSAPDVSSLTDDIQAKAAFKYNPKLEEQARNWIEAVLGLQPSPSVSFHDYLKDGVILCKLINKLKPGTIPQIHASKIAYKQMENIEAYTRACVQALGMSPFDCFNTVDLFEAKDMNLVINNIHVLAKHVKTQGIGGSDIPAIADSRRARRAYSIFIAEVAGYNPLAQEPEVLSPEDKELIDWMNGHLRKDGGKLVSSLHRDLKDGLPIIRLLQQLSEQSVGHYEVEPRLPWHRIQNATLILRFISEQTFFTIRGCTAHDIFLGHVEPLKVLLRYIREKFDREYAFRGMEKHVRRQKIVEELITTERTYVTLLRALVDGLVIPLKRGEGSAVLTREEVEEVFANVDEVVAFHTILLALFEERLHTFAPDSLIGDLFVQKFDEKFLAMYKRYVRDFDSLHLIIHYLEVEKPQFAKLIQEFEKEQAATTGGLHLNSFLILPVQRPPRYMLLIQELVKHTPEDHPDSTNLKRASELVGSILDELNASKKRSDSQEKLSSIENSIDGWQQLPIESLVHPKRRYIREGPLIWKGESDDNPSPYFFLFNDFLMYTSKKETETEGNEADEDDQVNEDSKPFTYLTLIPINFISEVKPNASDPCAFDLTFEDETGCFVAPSESEKKQWIEDLQHCIQEKVVIQFFDE
jgi:hypothetical protein